MVNFTFLAQTSVLMIDSIFNIVFVVTRDKGGWIIYFCLFLAILSIALLFIKIENLKGFREIHRSLIRLTIVIIFTEASLYQPSILILLGHFQQIILEDRASKVLGFFYLAIRTSIYQSGDTLFIVLKYLVLTAPFIMIKIPIQNQANSEQSLPLSVLEVINSEQFAIYKNSPQNQVYSNLGDDIFVLQSQRMDQLGIAISSNTQRFGQHPLISQQQDQNTSQNQAYEIQELRRVQSRSLHYEKITQILEKFFNSNKSLRHQSLSLFEDRQMNITKLEINSDIYVVINLISNVQKQRRVDLDWRENVLRILHKVAHDMRTPLNAIINMQSCLREYLDPFYIQRYLKPSLNSCKLLMHLLNDILDAAQIGQKNIRIVKKPFDLDKLIRKTIQLFEVQATSKKIQISVLNHLDKKYITSDKQRLRQILMNLLSNAIKYTSQQVLFKNNLEGQVYIKVSQTEENLIEVSVEDTGLGIKQIDLEQLFKDFHRITNKEDEALNSRGIGLGLQISKDLAILMGSPYGVKVESTYGVGTTFTFCIINDNQEDSVEDSREHGPYKQIENLNPLENHSFPNDQYEDAIIISNNQESVDVQEMMKLSPPVQIKIPIIAVKTPVKSASEEFKHLKAQQSGMENSQPIRYQFANSRYFTASFQDLQLDSVQSLRLSQRVLDKQSSTNKTQKIDILLKTMISQWKEFFNGKPELLVVDDNEYNIMALQYLLESLGIFADSAISGIEAIKLVTKRENENQQYRCVFMDIEMDGMDGFQTNYHLKSINSNLIVFACSGWSNDKIKEDCIKAGMQDVISKPVQKQIIKRLFSRHFEFLRVNSQQLRLAS